MPSWPSAPIVPLLTVPNAGGYFQARQSFDGLPPTSANPHSPQYSSDFQFDPEIITPEWTGVEGAYTTESVQWPMAIATQNRMPNYQNAYSDHTPTPSQSPWNSQTARDHGGGVEATTGSVTFEPDRGAPYETYRLGEDYLRIGHQISEAYGIEPVSPLTDGEIDGWQVVSSYPPSSTYSYDSPQSQGSPWSHIRSPSPSSSPPEQPAEPHSHVFSVFLGEPKLASTRGRQRALTSQEKQEALVVRKAKACWACHLSKIKVFILQTTI